jgi:hypothetical protein
MVLSADELEKRYLDIYNTYQRIEHNYKTNIISIGQALKDKYSEFQSKYVKLFRKILTDQVTEHFLATILEIHKKTLEESKRKRFEQDNPDVYKTIQDGGLHTLLTQIQVIRQNIHEYREGYKQDYLNDVKKAKSEFINKYRSLITNSRYKRLFMGWINQTMPRDVSRQLLKSYRKLDTNKLNEHDSAQEYSQFIVDEYIKPNIPKNHSQ